MARIYTLRVEVALIHPPIWRGVEVPSITSLATLHLILQRLLGWDNSALYEFECAGERFGAIDYDTLGRDDPRAYDVRDVRLSRLLGESRRKMRYIYDPMGEAWEHDLTLIAAGTPEEGVRYPRCVGGERSGPLRGVGGVIGYQELLRRWRERRERPADALWPAHFDPEYFRADDVWLESFEQLSSLADASAGFHTIDLWSFAKPPEQAQPSDAQLEFERQIAERLAPPARPAPPEFAGVQELVSVGEQRLRAVDDMSEVALDLLSFVEETASGLGKLSNLHTRQLAVDALRQIPGLIPVPEPEPEPEPKVAPAQLFRPSAGDPEPEKEVPEVHVGDGAEDLGALENASVESDESADEPSTEGEKQSDAEVASDAVAEESLEDSSAPEQGALQAEESAVEASEQPPEAATSEQVIEEPEALATLEPEREAEATVEVLFDEDGLKGVPSVLSLARALSRLPVAWLDTIARTLAIEAPAPRREEREAQIIAELSGLEEVDEMIDTLDTGALDLLEAMLADLVVIPASELLAGDVCGPDLRFDGEGSVGALRRVGVLFASKRAGEVVFWVPDELRQLLGIALD